MTQKQQIQYEVKVNGMPNYGKIPKATLEPIAKKLLEDILKQMKQQNSNQKEET